MNIVKPNKSKMTLKAIFEQKTIEPFIIQKINTITENFTKKIAYIFLGKESEYTKEILKKAIKEIVGKSVRDYQIDVESFVKKDLDEQVVVSLFNFEYEFDRAQLFNLKTVNKDKPKANLDLINVKNKKSLEKSQILSQAINWARNYQIMPPNILRSTVFAQKIKEDLIDLDNLKLTILNKKAVEDLGMGLFLSVNAGSAFEPRLVTIEYNGAPNKKEKTVLVGKGIMYDSGGMSIKPSQFMVGMKFDMSGAAIVAATLKAIAKLKPKANVAAVLMLTDNMVSNLASIPDAVFTSMNGKTVEVNNTDAEGRLVLADGITYAIRQLNATRVIDVATLTGAVRIALGQTFAGAWASNDQAWQNLSDAAQRAQENVWRMPFHVDYAKNIRKSKVADLKNTDFTKNAGSNAAAMFLKEFSEGKEFIHLDIAAIAEIDEIPQAPMIKTLFEFINN